MTLHYDAQAQALIEEKKNEEILFVRFFRCSVYVQILHRVSATHSIFLSCSESTHSLWHWQMACDALHTHRERERDAYTNAWLWLMACFRFFIHLSAIRFHERSRRKLLKYQTTTYVLSLLFIVDIVYGWFFFICTKYSSLEAFLVLLA